MHRILQACVLHATLILQRFTRSQFQRQQRRQFLCQQRQRYACTKQLLHQLSTYAKLLKSQRRGNRQPPPVPFETPIKMSTDSDRKFLQHPFRNCGMPYAITLTEEDTPWQK
jgi:hypothetical protein